MDRSRISEILQLTRQMGADEARISFSYALQNSFTAFNDKIDKIHSALDNSLTLSIFADGKYGQFTTNRLNRDDLRSFIENGVKLVSLIEKDPHRHLPPADRYYRGGMPDLGLCDDSFYLIDPDVKKQLALAAAEEIRSGAGARFRGAETSFDDSIVESITADTQGFYGEEKSTSFSISASASLSDDDGSIPESFWVERTLFYKDLPKNGCGEKAVNLGLAALNPHKIKKGKYRVVIDSRVASRVVMPIVNALDGASIDQNNSFLKDSLGRKLFPDILTIKDSPHMAGAFGASYFDFEGIATNSSYIIENGTVSRYFIDTYYSSKLGFPLNSGDYCVLEIEPTAKGLSREDILGECGSGVMITGFNGGNYNQVTGDFSFGIRGFYFENGHPVHSVREMNITGNIVTLFGSLTAVGDDPSTISAARIPTLAFDSGNLA